MDCDCIEAGHGELVPLYWHCVNQSMASTALDAAEQSRLNEARKLVKQEAFRMKRALDASVNDDARTQFQS